VRGLLWSLLLTSLLVVGCASAPVHTEGVTGPVAWHATEFQLAKNTIQGQPSEWYAFTLVRLANACHSHEKKPIVWTALDIGLWVNEGVSGDVVGLCNNGLPGTRNSVR